MSVNFNVAGSASQHGRPSKLEADVEAALQEMGYVCMNNKAKDMLKLGRKGKRALRTVQKRGNPSRLEARVANALTKDGVSYLTQVKVGRYFLDFAIGDIALEVQGCYWHKCPECGYVDKRKWYTDRRRKAYLEKRGWNVIYVWEHQLRYSMKETLEHALS